MIRFFFLLMPLLVCFGASTTFAQGVGGGEQLTVLLNPEYPQPNQTISITPKSSYIDLSSATVSISVNGTIVEKGSGVITGYARTGNAGERTTIVVTVVSGGQTYRKEISVRPADVALVLESISTAHPFYEGGNLVASEGRVRLVAIPNIRTAAGTAVAPENLVYTWKLGDQLLESASGIGRSTLNATAPVRFRDAVVSLTVATQDSAVVAHAQTAVTAVDPFIRIYRYDPLLGPLFDKAFAGSVTIGSDEETFRMVPYFFASTPTLAWQVNSVPSGQDKDITVRATGNGTGSALLAASANLQTMFQSATTPLNVRFGEGGGFNLFGI